MADVCLPLTSTHVRVKGDDSNYTLSYEGDFAHVISMWIWLNGLLSDEDPLAHMRKICSSLLVLLRELVF